MIWLLWDRGKISLSEIDQLSFNDIDEAYTVMEIIMDADARLSKLTS